MNFASIKLLGRLSPTGHQGISTLLRHNLLRSSSSHFSTTSQCVSESSEDQFRLRHQMTTEKNTNTNWVVYRAASVGLLGGLAGCFIMPGNMLIDFVTVTLLVHHNYFGLKSVIADYAPLVSKQWFTNLLHAVWLLISVMTLGLLYTFNYNNIGFSNALVKFFKL